MTKSEFKRRVGSGLLPEHRRWANINPLTIKKINGQNV
jgi:hypothetical protein